MKWIYSRPRVRVFAFLVPLLGICVGSVMGQAYLGYTLFAPNNSRNTYLIDMNNNVVHTWTHNKSGGYSVYLLSDGTILRPAVSSNSSLGGGGEEGIVQRVDKNNSVVWEYQYSSSTYRSHHDIEPMPNGNVLLVAWEVKTAAQAVQAGLNRSMSIWPDHIVEVQPTGSSGGNIVWQWHAWDHLIQQYSQSKSNYGVVADHPELLNINMGSSGVGPGGGDWMHINGISYNPELDQIVISSHTLNEIYVIDHSTTTAEAAGHSGGRSGKGGDILYRWGMPSNYGVSAAQYFDVVHCSVWIPAGLPGAGNIMAFNNREKEGTSQVVELFPPMDTGGNFTLTAGQPFGPDGPVWIYTASGFYSNHLGGCQRLPNGNTLIVESTSGYMFEVNAAGDVQWSYSRGGEIVRALRYSPQYTGLISLGVDESASTVPQQFELAQNWPNPFNPLTIIKYTIGGARGQGSGARNVELRVYDVLGREVTVLVNENKAPGSYEVRFDGSGLASGVYIYRLTAGTLVQSRTMVLLK
jgi:hypothetical protein